MMIKCPACDTVQAAIVEYTTPFATWIHHCSKCEYTIMESEWDIVVPYIMKPTDSIAKPNVSGSCRHEWKYNRTINVKVCTKCNYAENYSDLDNYR